MEKPPVFNELVRYRGQVDRMPTTADWALMNLKFRRIVAAERLSAVGYRQRYAFSTAVSHAMFAVRNEERTGPIVHIIEALDRS